MNEEDAHIAALERRLLALEDEKHRLAAELHALRQNSQQEQREAVAKNAPVSLDPITPDRIKLFMSLFRGRPDVFPKRWDNMKTGRSGYSPACKNEWAKGVCDKPRVPCSACTNQAWFPVTEDIIRKHLCGDTGGWQPRDYTIGVYPILKDKTCWFLAVDFDKENWQRDVAAFAATCCKKNVPVAVERSRSGNGAQALQRPFEHRVVVRDTQLLPPTQPDGDDKLPIHAIYAHVVDSVSRNDLICQDIRDSLAKGGTPLVLTERKEHAIQIAERLKETCPYVIVLHGGLSNKARKEALKNLTNIPESEPRLIVATGRYIGEGFDDPRLDTLFLAMPISWHGTLAQYAGRLHRLHHAKKEVIIYDYVDRQIPMLARMAEKRMKGYTRLGYTIKQSS